MHFMRLIRQIKDGSPRHLCRCQTFMVFLFCSRIILQQRISLTTTAGSYALLGSVVPRDAGVVEKLRKAGEITLGKASLSEWSHYRADFIPSGWCARGGQAVVCLCY